MTGLLGALSQEQIDEMLTYDGPESFGCLPEIGRLLKKYRAKHELRLLDMARALNMGIAELSGIEVGREKEPDGFRDRVKAVYGDDCLTEATFETALDKAVEACRLSDQ